MGDRAVPFIMRLLTNPPLCTEPDLALEMTKDLRYFWADIAAGDAKFSFPEFSPKARDYFEAFSGGTHPDENRLPADNDTVLSVI